MQDDDDDLGTIAWPGFVDILSSVIIMFVFFVMIVASALYFHIIIFKSKILSELNESTYSQAEAKELASTNRSLTKKIKEMTEKMKLLEELSQDNDIQLYKDDSEFSESAEQKIIEDLQNNALTIFFGGDSISVTKGNQEVLTQHIKDFIAKYSADNIEVDIIAGKNPNSVNDIIARRLAVARLLNVRNSLLETEIPPNKIRPIITEKESVDGSYNWVKLRFNPK